MLARLPRYLRSVKLDSSFSTSAPCLANRAVVYAAPGDPTQILKTLTFPALPSPPKDSVNIRFLLSPINPADINVLQGVYPSKPKPTTSLAGSDDLHKLDQPLFVGGNEGLAEIVTVGEGVTRFKKGDRVVMATAQNGTWASERCVKEHEVMKCPEGLTDVGGATMTVNPPTAWNLLHDFVDLKPGDWVIQNGANSAVGQAVIQIAARKGFNTLNFVRNRDNIEELRSDLENLGATKVLTYDELDDKAFRGKVKEWVGSNPPRLFLNSVSGPTTPSIARLLSTSPTSPSYLVSYGAMSKQPLTLPTGLFIFGDLRAVGFWQSRWNQQKGIREREELLQTLADLKLRDPLNEVVTISGEMSDEEAGELVRKTVSDVVEGRRGGKKVLLRVEETK